MAILARVFAAQRGAIGVLAGAAVRIAWYVPTLRPLIFRLPPAMRQLLLARFFAIAYDRFNRTGNIPRTLVARGFVLRQTAELMGTVGTFHGHKAANIALGELREAWDNVHFHPVEVEDIASGRILVVAQFSGRGRGSGVEFSRRLGHVFVLERGRRAKRMEVYWEPGDARHAVRAAG